MNIFNRFIIIIEIYLIAIIGGFIFFITGLPLPWILGPALFILLWRLLSKQKVFVPIQLKNASYILLGISIGLYFVAETFLAISSYAIPFFLITLLLIAFSVTIALIVTRYIEIDKTTSVFGLIPGGLSVMVAASESFKSNVSLVAIIQTIRLISVLFIVPFIILSLFNHSNSTETIITTTRTDAFSLIGVVLFIFIGFSGWLCRKWLPGPYVVGPLLVTAVFNVIGFPLFSLPTFLLVFAQMTIGLTIGIGLSIEDLKRCGKYSVIYLGISLLLIFFSLSLGYLLSLLTTLDLPTAMLSIAPGGLIEMTLTATSVGADPSIVSSLQLIRLLFVVLIVPKILQWGFNFYYNKKNCMPKNE